MLTNWQIIGEYVELTFTNIQHNKDFSEYKAISYTGKILILEFIRLAKKINEIKKGENK